MLENPPITNMSSPHERPDGVTPAAHSRPPDALASVASVRVAVDCFTVVLSRWHAAIQQWL